jgi:hypothetical protein
MTHKIFTNRRGEDMIVDFWAILVFAIICILFLILFSFSKSADAKDVKSEFMNKDANFMLQAFLRAPAIGIDESKTVADIIAEDDAKDDFDATDKLFAEFFMGMKEYNVYLNVDGTNTENFKKKLGLSLLERTITVPIGGYYLPGVMILPKGEEYNAVAYIPGYDGRIQLKLKVDETLERNNEGITQGN